MLPLLAAAPGEARKKSPPQQPAAVVIPQVRSGDAGIDAYYYFDRSGAPIWLSNDIGRQAASKFAEVLDRATIDGFAEGPVLAMSVRAAIAGGTLGDDARISLAWLKYARALKAPVNGIVYGDAALRPAPMTAKQLLTELVAAPSMTAYVTQFSQVNPMYAALREQALASGSAADPRVRATLDRLRVVPATGRAILVDIASARMWMLENGQPVDSMKVIVGKTSAPTPLMAGTIHYVTFNPYWHILDEVVRRKVAPVVIKRGVSYLKAARYDTVSDWTNPQPVDPSTIDWKAVAAGTQQAFIRQKPGANNMMGAMKFSFENEQDIFLHDTPHRGLFSKEQRTLSLGCVRLEHADRLARWLLGRDAAPPSDAPELHVQIDQGVPVFLTYLTARVDNGQLAFAKDVYRLDPAPAAEAVASASVIAPVIATQSEGAAGSTPADSEATAH